MVEKQLLDRYASWLEIDTQALIHNCKQYKKLSPESLVAPVIKSNAYGHGLLLVASLLDTLPEVDILCLVSVTEALSLRTAGITKELLVLSILDGDLEAAVIENIDLVAYDYETVKELNTLGKKHAKKVRIHIKIDTGLSRLGIRAEEALSFIQACSGLDNIEIRALFSHLADSENTASEFTHYQINLLDTLYQEAHEAGIPIPLSHISCSAALKNYPSSRKQLVRLGIGLYGLWSNQETHNAAQLTYPTFTLKPVLSWKTRIIQIKNIPAGSFVGYGKTHCVMRDSRLAILPVGYADGYDRRLSNKGIVLIDNQEAPLLGRVAMNLVIVDITGLAVNKDSEVIVMSDSPLCSIERIASLCDTITYEIVARLNPLLPRIIKS